MFVPEESTLYILSGGRSSRFGRDKAVAEVDGLPLLLHTVETLAHLFSGTYVVSNGTRTYAHLGVATIHDVNPDRGPCAGIAKALTVCPTPWAFICACDVTGISSDLVEKYRGVREAAGRFDVRSQTWSVFPAALPVALAETFAVAENRSVWRVLESVNATKIAGEKLLDWNEPSRPATR